MRLLKISIIFSLASIFLLFFNIEREGFEPIVDVEESTVEEELFTVKGVYLTGWSAGSKSYREYLFDLIEKSEINSVVIDIKDYSGRLSYISHVVDVGQNKIPDISQFIEELHNRGVYVIGRITVFQDPILAFDRDDLAIRRSSGIIWTDRLGLAWVDPASKDVWDYNILIAKEAVEVGFDEINFDYIRFPSDGDLGDMTFPVWDRENSMSETIADFYKYLREELPDVIISADLFGLSTVSLSDLGIGQVIEDASLYFDYLSPMVYPSHYASGFLGYDAPAEYPYEVVKYSLDSALSRLDNNVKIRPWLQDFSLTTLYNQEMVLDQIRAVKDAAGEGYVGYMLWSPSNRYTVIR